MHDVLDDMRATLERRGFRPNTIATYLLRARKFLRWLDEPAATTTRRDVERCVLGAARRGAAWRRRLAT